MAVVLKEAFEPARGTEGVLDGELQRKVEAVGQAQGVEGPCLHCLPQPITVFGFLGFWTLFKALSIRESEVPFLFAVAVL